jgi:hypothetical protein
VALLAAACLLLSACAAARLEPAAPGAQAAAPAFQFARDTFAFPNEIQARNPGVPDLYANYCFVLARGLRQFLGGARFDPALPRLDHAGYVALVRRVAARPPWAAPLPPDARVTVPGYASLREFSRAQEAAVKEGLGGRFWTLVHWTNWRVVFPVPGAQQETVARETMDELRGGRPVQWLVTNWPKPELNHTVVAYEYREREGAVDFVVWDPNEPAGPGIVTFRRDERRFWATRVYDTEAGPIRAFRMYYSWAL